MPATKPIVIHIFPTWDLDHDHNVVPHCLQSLSIIGKLRAARSRLSLFSVSNAKLHMHEFHAENI